MKKLISLLLCISIMVCMMPFMSFADEVDGKTYVEISADMEFPVAAKSNVELTANLYRADAAASYEYQWYVESDGMFTAIEYLANSSVYKVKKIKKTTRYKVVVRLNGELVAYDVIKLKVAGDNEQEIKVSLDAVNFDADETIAEGTAITLQAYCDAPEETALEYRWYSKGYYDSDLAYERIIGASSDTYSTSATDSCYKVDVLSKGVSLGTAVLELNTWNSLSSDYRYDYIQCSDPLYYASEGAEISFNAETSVMKDVTVQKKTSGVWKDDFSESVRTALSYSWTSNDGTLTSGAKSKTIKVKPKASSAYTVEVSYKGKVILKKSYLAEKSGDAFALDGIEITSSNMIDGEAYIASGTSLTLNITNNSKYTYQWFNAEDEANILANAASYTTPAITKNSVYGCIVSNEEYSACLYYKVNVFAGTLSLDSGVQVSFPEGEAAESKSYVITVDGSKVVILAEADGCVAYCITGSGAGSFTSTSAYNKRATISFVSAGSKTYFINLTSYDNTPDKNLVVSECKHSNTAVVNVVAATTAAGGYTGDTVCNDCGKLYAKGFNTEHIHVLEEHPAKARGCVADGNKAYWICNCGVVFKNAAQTERYSSISETVLGKLGHVESGFVVDKNPTCAVAGSKHTYCTRCNATMKTESIAATGAHNKSTVKTTNPTCTKAGEKHYYCSGCGKDMGADAIPALGHSYETQGYVEANCQHEGYTGDKVCKTCNDTQTGSVIPIKEHSYELFKQADADCEHDGYSGDKVCSVCGDTVQGSVIPKLGHKVIKVKKKNPTCCEYGYKAHYECEHCGQCYAAKNGKKKTKLTTYRIKKVKHSFTKKIVEAKYLKKKATKKSPAIYKYACKWCGKAGSKTYKYGKKLK